jgi:hypothetical protein
MLVAFLLFKLEAPLLGGVAIVQAVGIAVVGVFATVALLGAAESIRVFIDIEENTRATRQMMEYDMANKYRTAPPPTEATTAGSPQTNKPPQSAGHVRFGGTTSR